MKFLLVCAGVTTAANLVAMSLNPPRPPQNSTATAPRGTAQAQRLTTTIGSSDAATAAQVGDYDVPKTLTIMCSLEDEAAAVVFADKVAYSDHARANLASETQSVSAKRP